MNPVDDQHPAGVGSRLLGEDVLDVEAAMTMTMMGAHRADPTVASDIATATSR